MVSYDKFGRTWKGRKIVWIKSANCARLALYRRVIREDKKMLIYDKKRGMYDKDGYHIRDMVIEMIPALEGKDKYGKPVPNTWEKFPDTDEAYNFTRSITQNGIVNQEIENSSDFYDEYDEYDEYNEYDEEIIIR